MSFEDLLQELPDPSSPLTVSKLTALSRMGQEQTSLFMNAWLQMDVRRRQWLIQELIDLAEDNVELNFDAVFFIALADMDVDVRRHAIRGLWEHEGRDMIDALIGLLERDPAAGVRADAALGLGRFVLQSEFETVRAPDVERIEQTLRRAVTNSAEVPEVRGRALEAVGARCQPWVRPLIEEAYAGSDRVLRLSAVHAMGRSCDPAWLPTLVRELRSDEPAMRYEAAGACGSIADDTATAYLLPLLEDDDVEVQEAAISALGQIGGAAAKRALRELIAAQDDRVRDAAQLALAEIDFAEDPLAFKTQEWRG